MKHFMSRYSIKTKLLFAALFLAIAFSSVQKVSAQTLTAKYNTSMVANSGGYYEYLPEGYNSTTEKYPLLIFIHGVYEKGDGSTSKLPLILKFGLPKNITWATFPNLSTWTERCSGLLLFPHSSKHGRVMPTLMG
jgi:hypothetical protein